MKANRDYKSRFKLLKGGKVALIISTIMGTVTLYATPSGENIVSGDISIDRTIPNTTNINQSSNKGIINWQSFDVNQNETVNFNMPNSNSSTLNRVLSNNPSKIYGKINSNGQVFLVNQNGIYFGKDSQINTAGFTASTLDITNENFLNSNYIFEGTSNASILNLGTINTDNAYTALLAKEVINEGVIQARLGNIQLASGEKITLDINGNSLVKLTIDKGTLNALVENKNLIQADGGIVYLTTKALDTVLNGVVNNTGVIEANSIEEKDGKIILFAHGGTADIGGTITTGEHKGFIETSGKEFSIKEGTKITTGNWLLDPVNITIDSTLATTLEGQLLSGDATVTTSGAGTDEGDINVNSSISWSANKLTLRADNDININTALNATSTAGLSLEYAQTTGTGTYNIKAPVNLASTGSFSTKKGTDAVKNYTIITSLGGSGSTTGTDLQGINGNLSGNYVLGTNIDASVTSAWNGGAGWDSLMDGGTRFTGNFDGLGHTVSNLYINGGSNEGLFRYIDTVGSVSNLGLINVDITGTLGIGALAGNNYGIIRNSYATGSVKGIIDGFDIGGLVGLTHGTITNSYTSVTVSGIEKVGGLVGQNGSAGIITSSYATGNVSGTSFIIGGLVGQNGSGTITNSYATGNVSGTSHVGGLVGNSNGTITNSYATGNVSGTSKIGGLLGNKDSSGTVNSSYWNIETSGQSTSAGGIGKTTNQLKDINTYAGWDIESVTNSSYTGFPYAGLTMGGATIWQMKTTATPTSTSSATSNYQNIINSILRESGNNKEIKEVFAKNNNLKVVLEDDKQTKVSRVSQDQLSDIDDINDIKLALVPNRIIQVTNGGIRLPDGLSPDFYMQEKSN